MKPPKDLDRNAVTEAALYSDHPEGGCVDIGVLRLSPDYVIVRAEEYRRLKDSDEYLKGLRELSEALQSKSGGTR